MEPLAGELDGPDPALRLESEKVAPIHPHTRKGAPIGSPRTKQLGVLVDDLRQYRRATLE